jgi:hypothetical protein
MRRAMLMALGLAACGGEGSPVDADHDGFSSADDCDDTDAFVYPGAPDDPGDGVDADCDGVDPQHAFVGEWELVFLSAMFSSFQLVDEGTETGGITLSEDMSVQMDAGIGLDPDLLGYELSVPVVMDGWVSPLEGESRSWLRVDGEAAGETSFIEFECVTEADVMDCQGVLLALGVNLDTVATFERR